MQATLAADDAVVAQAANTSSNSAATEIVELPAVVVFGQRPDAIITPELLQRLGGVEGTRDWVGIMMSNLRLAYPLRQKLARFETAGQRAELNQLLVNTMLGRPLGVEKSTIETVANLELTSEEFNLITESVLVTCDDTHMSYRECNRILVSIRPVGLYARGF